MPSRLAPAGPLRPALPFLGALGCALAATVAGLSLGGALAQRDVAMMLLLGVLASGAAFGLRPALLCAAVSALSYNFVFLEPRFTLRIARPGDVLAFAGFFAAALATGWLGGRARDGERRAAKGEAETRRLLASTRLLAAAARSQQAAQVLVEQARAATGADAAVLVGAGDALALCASAPAVEELEPVSALAARWTLQRGEPSGAGTEVSATAEWSLHPLKGSAGAEGVLALRGGAGLDRRGAGGLVAGLCDAGGLALERARLAEAAVENEALRRSDRLRSALLNSLGHDLRTPLAGILGSATTLLDYGPSLKAGVATDLLVGIREEAERLRRYLADLIDLSRLEAGALAPRLEWTDLRDVTAAAADRVASRLPEGVRRREPAEAALAEVDAVLLQQAMVNVLENAAAHAPGAVDLRLARDGAAWRLEVEDEGPGLPPEALESVFRPFHRLDGAAASPVGSGLGLSIARGFAEAMGGSLRAESPVRDGRGARFTFRFPDRATA